MNAARPEPDLAFCFIHTLYAAHDPRPFGDLVFDLTCLLIEEVEVIPSVALGHPENFVAVIQVMDELLSGVIDERFALLIND